MQLMEFDRYYVLIRGAVINNHLPYYTTSTSFLIIYQVLTYQTGYFFTFQLPEYVICFGNLYY